MSRIRDRDTAPEKRVRSLLHQLGCRFSLRRKDLPGKPDIVLPARHTVVFVHGCFWHQHQGCSKAFMPRTRQSYWEAKLKGNAVRDSRIGKQLRSLGWQVMTVWECELADEERLARRLAQMLMQKTTRDQIIPPGDDFRGTSSKKDNAAIGAEMRWPRRAGAMNMN